MRASIATFFWVLLLFGMAAPTYSQEPERTRQEKAAAAFQQGAELFYKNEFAAALVKFKAAYALNPDALILYNISLTHQRLGNLEDSLETAVDAAEMGTLPGEPELRNRSRIHALRAVVQARAIARASSEGKPEAVAAVAEDPEEEPDTQIAQTAPAPEPSSGLGGLGWAGIGIAGVGVAMLTGSAVNEMSLEDDVSSLRDAAQAGDRADSLREDIEGRQTLGQILLFGGAGLTATGLTLFVVDLLGTSEATPSATFRPDVGPDRAGFTLDGRF